MNRFFGILFFAVLVKPIVFIILGLNLRGKNNLPLQGPAIIAANHNSHLDTLVLMSLYPLAKLHKIRPVAAADYFLKNRFIAWFSLRCIGIIPLDRKGIAKKEELFAACHKALDNDDILIVFPEGSRGHPEQLSTIKKGVFYIAKARAETTITPVMMRGLGLSLPRNEALFVPFNCDVIIGEPLAKTATSKQFVAEIGKAFEQLEPYCITRTS